MEKDQFTKAVGQVIAKAWQDEGFAARLREDPAAALRAHGVDLPASARVRLVETAPGEFPLVLPPRPSGELDEEHLQNVAGGSTVGTAGTSGTAGTICGTAGSLGTVGTAGSAS